MGNLYYLIDNYYSYQYEQNNIMDRISDLEIMQKTFEIENEKISSFGLLTLDDEGNAVEFLHQTVAEFFVAQYFIDKIYKANEVELDEMEKRIEIFIFILKNSNFEIVQNFIDDFLALQKGEKNFAKIIQNLMTKKFANSALKFSESESPEILYKFFESDKIISEFLGNSFDWLKTNFAISLGPKINYKMLKWEKIWQLYVRYNQRGKIFYQLWSKEEKISNFIAKIVKVDKEISKNLKEIKNFDEFFKFTVKNLTRTEQRELILRYFPEMFGKFAIGESFEEIWREIKMSGEKIKKKIFGSFQKAFSRKL